MAEHLDAPKHPIEVLRDEFLTAMAMLYPDGPSGPEMHVGLVRTWTMAWVAALLGAGDADLETYRPLVQAISHPEWLPSVEWAWWDQPDRPQIVTLDDAASLDEAMDLLKRRPPGLGR
jgi:hypothetical protein